MGEGQGLQIAELFAEWEHGTWYELTLFSLIRISFEGEKPLWTMGGQANLGAIVTDRGNLYAFPVRLLMKESEYKKSNTLLKKIEPSVHIASISHHFLFILSLRWRIVPRQEDGFWPQEFLLHLRERRALSFDARPGA